MKKIIIIFGMLSLIFFLLHMILATRYFVGITGYSTLINMMGIIFVVFLSVHAFCAVYRMIKNSKKTKNDVFYGKYMYISGLQNISGICIYVCGILHAVAIEINRAIALNITNILWLCIDILLYISVCVHMAIAIPRMFISSGIIINKRLYRFVKTVCVTVNAVLFILLAYSHFVFI